MVQSLDVKAGGAVSLPPAPADTVANMADSKLILDSPDRIAEEGQRIYLAKYRESLERTNIGQFVAIDVLSGQAYVGKFAEIALDEARKKAPNGVFHLVRIGSPGAFKVSFGAAKREAADPIAAVGSFLCS